MSNGKNGESVSSILSEPQITLGEGGTPLLPSRRIGPQAGLRRLWLKIESANPTGSYKDRFAAAAISEMARRGQKLCLATSSGNTGAALAAYCALAEIRCRIAIVETAPEGKMKQMRAYGAELARIRGFGLDSRVTETVMRELQSLAQRPEAALQISAFKYSPIGMSGVQTIAYELAEQLPEVAHVFCPAGGGGLTLAVAKGFMALVERRVIARSPAIHCVQPQGNNTMAGPLRNGLGCGQDVECTSRISGLQVPNVIDANETIGACRATGGTGILIGDDDAWKAQERLARDEGVFCEPAAAVAVAGALRAVDEGLLASDDNVACLITGSAFKDPPSLDRLAGATPSITLDASALAEWVGAE